MDFIRDLFKDKKEENYILIWEKGNAKISRWYKKAEDIKIKDLQKNNIDVYIGVGTSPQDFGPNKRCPADQISGIPAFWADIDIQSEHHQKLNLPKNIEDAKTIFGDFPPTFIINSGHGLHCWWQFQEFWNFEDSEDRETAMIMAKAFQKRLFERAKNHGWTLDATHDLSRVLRIPGTFNYKDRTQPLKVEIIECNELFYEPDILTDGYEIGMALVETKDDKDTNFKIRSGAEPPWKIQFLIENSMDFKRTWEHKRKDFHDSSQSAYDYSLTQQFMKAGWSDQEIIDALVFNRLKYAEKHKDKIRRTDYYKRLLENCREAIGEYITIKNAASESKNIVRKLDQTEKDSNIPKKEKNKIEKESKDEGLVLLTQMLGFKINEIKKYEVDTPSYKIITPTGAAEFESAAELLSQSKFRARIYETVDKLPNKLKGPDWDKATNLMARIATKERMGDEVSNEGFVKSMLLKYLEQSDDGNYEKDEALEEDLPFVENGQLNLSLTEVRSFINNTTGIKFTLKKLGIIFRTLGGKDKRMRIRHTCKNRWIFNLKKLEYTE